MPALLQRCEAAMQQALGDAGHRGPLADLLSRHHPARPRQGHLRAGDGAGGSGISTDAVATIGDMQNDLAMFEVSGMSIAMGNATDDVKKHATRVTASNEEDGFAGDRDDFERRTRKAG